MYVLVAGQFAAQREKCNNEVEHVPAVEPKSTKIGAELQTYFQDEYKQTSVVDDFEEHNPERLRIVKIAVKTRILVDFGENAERDAVDDQQSEYYSTQNMMGYQPLQEFTERGPASMLVKDLVSYPLAGWNLHFFLKLQLNSYYLIC